MDNQQGWQILEQCLGRADEPAWETFAARFEPALRGGIFRALEHIGYDGDRKDVADDLVQECYCKILARDRRVLRMCRERNDNALNAFFARLAERATRDAFRARWAQKRGSRDAVVPWNEVIEERATSAKPSSPEDDLLCKEARASLLAKCRRAAGGVERERNFQVLSMAFLGGLSSKEIAERFSGRLSRTCIDSLVYRARRRLHKQGTYLGPRRAMA